MSTTITNQPSSPSDHVTNPSDPGPVHRRHRRALLAVVVAGALGVGAGAAAVSLTSSSGDGGATRQAHTAAAAAPQVNVEALWHELVTLPVRDQTAILATLAPSVRAQLTTLTEAIAGAAEGVQGG